MPRGRPQLHYRDLRLFKAGITMPTCYATKVPLDLSRGQLPTTATRTEVTCPRCLERMRLGQPPGPQRN